MTLSMVDIELMQQIANNQRTKITNHTRIGKLMDMKLVIWNAQENIGWFLTEAGKEVLEIKASSDTYGPSESGYYTAGIDIPLTANANGIHYHAIEFHDKDKESAEALRDEVVAFLKNRKKDSDFDINFAKRVASQVLKVAVDIKQNAGYQGRFDDGGAGVLSREVDAFLAGLEKHFPAGNVWEEARLHVKQQDDPDYKEYLRLMKKFGK